MGRYFEIPSDALLHIIQDMIDEDKIGMKMNGNAGSDVLEGRMSALRELAVELGLCDYESLL
mgnify:CR=1 FL=1